MIFNHSIVNSLSSALRMYEMTSLTFDAFFSLFRNDFVSLENFECFEKLLDSDSRSTDDRFVSVIFDEELFRTNLSFNSLTEPFRMTFGDDLVTVSLSLSNFSVFVTL